MCVTRGSGRSERVSARVPECCTRCPAKVPRASHENGEGLSDREAWREDICGIIKLQCFKLSYSSKRQVFPTLCVTREAGRCERVSARVPECSERRAAREPRASHENGEGLSDREAKR